MSKIYLVFSEDFSLDILLDKDIVISPFLFKNVNADQQRQVNPNQIDLNNYRDDLELLKEKFVLTLTDILSRDAFNSSFNNFYSHIFRSIFKWIVLIEETLLEYPEMQIVLTEHINSENYLPYYEAEGEINRALFYKSYDFIPKYISDFLNVKSIDHIILIRKSSLRLYMRIFLRRVVLLNAKLILSVKCYVSFRFNRKAKSFLNHINQGEVCTVLLSRGVAHTQYFLPYMLQNSNSLLFVSDGIKSHNKNLKLFEDLSLKGVSNLHYITFRDNFCVFIEIVNSLIKSSVVSNSTVFRDIVFNFRSCLREMLISQFEVKLYERSLDRFLCNLRNSGIFNIVVISGEMFTPYNAVIGSTSAKFDIKSIQLQTSMVDYWPQVKFVFCDKFVFTSYQAYKFYRSYNPDEATKYDFWGSFIELPKVKLTSELRNVLYFSQPYEKQNEIRVVQALVDATTLQGAQLYIKLHPRDSKQKFQSIKGVLKFVDNHFIDNYLGNFQLTVVRTSAIGKEAILRGVPTVVILSTESDRTISNDYLQDRYKDFGCFVLNVDGLNKAIENFDNTVNEFVKFRDVFIEENRLSNKFPSFQSNLVELECQN